VTIALVEHDVRMVTGLCARVVVLDHGEKIADGVSTEVVQDPRVLAAYFGDDEQRERAHAA
jgi:branched-chain amino acid transport system ATP-binding protein